MKEKIETMLDQPVRTHVGSGLNRILVIAWPTDTLADRSGLFSGFVMPKVHAKRSLISAFDPHLRKSLFGEHILRKITCFMRMFSMFQAIIL